MERKEKGMNLTFVLRLCVHASAAKTPHAHIHIDSVIIVIIACMRKLSMMFKARTVAFVRKLSCVRVRPGKI